MTEITVMGKILGVGGVQKETSEVNRRVQLLPLRLKYREINRISS